MRLKFLRLFVIAILILINSILNKTIANPVVQEMQIMEDSLKNYFVSLSQEKEDYRKDSINSLILKCFREVLKNEEAANYSFDLIKSKIGIISSSDQKLRILCWNIPYLDGTHKYYGFIQYKKSKRNNLLYELNDQSEFIKNPEYAILNHTNWYGALYYKIITNKYKGNVYYTLLGADLNDLFTKKKIVEVLSFDKNDMPVFGAKVFKNNKSAVLRMIFEFSTQANMVLTYNEEKEMIIYDHLSPVRPSLQGEFEFYGPDFSYDALKFEHGIWNAYSDIDIRNNNIE